MRPRATLGRPPSGTAGAEAGAGRCAAKAGGRLRHLSRPEREVLALMVLELTGKQITQRLNASPLAVKGHKARMIGMLGVRSGNRAVPRGYQTGLLKAAPWERS